MWGAPFATHVPTITAVQMLFPAREEASLFPACLNVTRSFLQIFCLLNPILLLVSPILIGLPLRSGRETKHVLHCMRKRQSEKADIGTVSMYTSALNQLFYCITAVATRRWLLDWIKQWLT